MFICICISILTWLHEATSLQLESWQDRRRGKELLWIPSFNSFLSFKCLSMSDNQIIHLLLVFQCLSTTMLILLRLSTRSLSFHNLFTSSVLLQLSCWQIGIRFWLLQLWFLPSTWGFVPSNPGWASNQMWLGLTLAWPLASPLSCTTSCWSERSQSFSSGNVWMIQLLTCVHVFVRSLQDPVVDWKPVVFWRAAASDCHTRGGCLRGDEGGLGHCGYRRY